MDKTGKILVVDDDADILTAARMVLARQVAEVHTEKNPRKIAEILRLKDFDVILLDMNFSRHQSSGEEGLRWLGQILNIDPAMAVVMITAYGDIGLAVRAMKSGAFDFITKPWQNEKLWATVSAALNYRRTRREADRLRRRQKQLYADLDQPFKDFIGTSETMRQVVALIDKVAATDASILILGENGTGKEMVAREIHRRSHRAEEVFIAVDMGTVTETLFESELFGHIKGAFTDARNDRVGRFEMAHGGTLFLDEIGNLSMASQSKLLTVLENGRIVPVGSSWARDIDVRLISATNQPIYEWVASNEFRQDLLYRINTVEIVLPPLRERAGDIPVLADYFLNIFARKYHKPIKEIENSSRQLLQRYHWPGNVRELKHAIERAVIMSPANSLRPADFALRMQDRTSNLLHLKNYNINDMEGQLIMKVMDKHNGNISRAARELGLTRASLYRRMRKHDM